MASTKVKGSAEDFWAVLRDVGTWGEWWPLGSPEPSVAALAAGTQLVWRARNGSVAASAVVSDATRNGVTLTMTAGDDGLASKRDVSATWELHLDESNNLSVRRRDGAPRPATKKEIAKANSVFAVSRRNKIAKAEADIARKVAGVLERVVGQRGVPDIAGLRATNDLAGLAAAAQHPEAWVRVEAIDALRGKPGDAGVEAIIAAATDLDPSVRRASVLGLLPMQDERARVALLRLCEDPDPLVRGAARVHTSGMRATIAASETQPYTAGDLAQLHASAGPKFPAEPTEPFLGTRFAVYVREFGVLANAPGEDTVDEFGVRHRAVEPKTRFPTVCAGCLEPTERSLLGTVHALSWERSSKVGTTIHTTTTNVRVRFPIRMCERCAAYGLDTLVGVSGESRELAFDNTGRHEDWVRFQFPNLAYYPLFCEADDKRLDAIRPLSKKDKVLFGMRALPKVSKADRAEYDAALAAWERCRQRFGLHVYAALSHRLRQLESQVVDAATLTLVAQEQGVDVNALRELEEIAATPFAALRVLS